MLSRFTLRLPRFHLHRNFSFILYKILPMPNKKNTCKTTTQFWRYRLCIYDNSVLGRITHIRISSESVGNLRKLPTLRQELEERRWKKRRLLKKKFCNTLATDRRLVLSTVEGKITTLLWLRDSCHKCFVSKFVPVGEKIWYPRYRKPSTWKNHKFSKTKTFPAVFVLT